VLQRLREEDVPVITSMNRLGRSMLNMITLGADLRERGIGLKVLEQGIDTATAEGHAMFGMLPVLAELQRKLIVADTRDGLAAVRPRDSTTLRLYDYTPSPRAPTCRKCCAPTFMVIRTRDAWTYRSRSPWSPRHLHPGLGRAPGADTIPPLAPRQHTNA
jgi:hypothetical protein